MNICVMFVARSENKFCKGMVFNWDMFFIGGFMVVIVCFGLFFSVLVLLYLYLYVKLFGNLVESKRYGIIRFRVYGVTEM